jgi:hypothetical protein
MKAHRRTSGAVIAEASVADLGPRGVMGTGICFLDHMIDQFTSHAQLGVTVRVTVGEAAGGGGGGGAATEEELLKSSRTQGAEGEGESSRSNPNQRNLEFLYALLQG